MIVEKPLYVVALLAPIRQELSGFEGETRHRIAEGAAVWMEPPPPASSGTGRESINYIMPPFSAFLRKRNWNSTEIREDRAALVGAPGCCDDGVVKKGHGDRTEEVLG